MFALNKNLDVEPDFNDPIKAIMVEYNLTEERIVEYKALFSRFDENNDGKAVKQ